MQAALKERVNPLVGMTAGELRKHLVRTINPARRGPALTVRVRDRSRLLRSAL